MARRFVKHAERPFFDLSNPLIIKREDQTETRTHHTEAKNKQPPFDVEPWMKPFQKSHLWTPPVTHLRLRNQEHLLGRYFSSYPDAQ